MLTTPAWRRGSRGGRAELMIPSDAGEDPGRRPVGRLQLFTWALMALAAASVLVAILLAALVIWLLLTFCVVALATFWLITAAWRGRRRFRPRREAPPRVPRASASVHRLPPPSP